VIDHIPVPQERIGMELDEFLCLSFPLLNKRFLRDQVREGRVLVDGNPAMPSQRLRPDQVLFVDFDEARLPEAPPPAPGMELPVLYDEDGVLAVDKPSGLAVEPDRWRPDKPSLAASLLVTESAAEGNRPRIVHRLDRDTSGVLLVARDVEAERRLRTAFDTGLVSKTYHALVEGEHPLPDGEEEIVDKPIAPDARKSGRMRVHEDGKPARTRFAVEQRFQGYTLLRCEPLTGRTHQLRVHLRELGFPLAVDPIYGRRKVLALSEIKRGYRPKRGHIEHPLIDRLTLHAAAIEFPSSAGVRVRVESPIPRDLARVLKQLAKVRPFDGRGGRGGRGGQAGRER
jgi:RluA family pseudouridine synthase